MRTDPRSVLSGRPQTTSLHSTASRAVARRRAVGVLGALALLFALTSTGAWAEPTPPDTGTTPSAEPSPSESPSPDPTPTVVPSPSPSPTATASPTPRPTPSEAPADENEDSEDEESDGGEESEDEDPAADETTDDDPAPSEPGDPVTAEPTPKAATTVAFDSAGDLTLRRYVPTSLRVAAGEENPGPLAADFRSIVTPGSLTVEFQDQSECSWECEPHYWSWKFGDGTTSSVSDPTHTYATGGTYSVSLTVKYQGGAPDFPTVDLEQPRVAADESPECGSYIHIEGDYYEYIYCDTVTQSLTIPNASFTAQPSSGPAPLTVKFTDTSTGDIDSRAWSFNGPACGKASAGPTEAQFIEIFTTPGTCLVTLTVQFSNNDRRAGRVQAAASDSASKTITVTKPPVTPTQKPDDDDDDEDSDDSDDSDDDGDPTPGVFLPNQPPLTEQPTPEPTDPSPAPTTPIGPTPPTPPTEPVDPKPAAWITGNGASGAGIALMILAAVIGSMRGLSMAGHKVALVADRDENTIQRHVAARDAEGWGDRSFTWRFPGHRLIDAASVVLPDRLFRFSPLVGRIAEDGSEFRAMFGTLWLATPLAGIALGIASASAAAGRALPPSVWLVAAGAVLATFDAFSGAIAVVLFAGAALMGGLGGAEGGPDAVHSVLVILAIGFLWMAIPLIGSAIRPFRRLGDGSLRHRWDVIGDGLIAALLCGWVAQKLTQAMDLFAGQKTGLPEHANTIAIVVMVAVALRVSMEHFAMSAYPQRLQQVEGEDPPSPFLVSVVLGAFIRTAVFGFIGYAFIGSCWQLWVGVGLFLIPQLIDHLRERFRNIGLVQRILPRGVVEIFILVVTCTLIARYAMNQTPDEFTGLRMAFLLIAIPPALLGVLRAFAEDADESGDRSWSREFLGAIIVAVTAVLAARGWDY